MNRELIVTLLRKDIQELDMITEGFMEMKEYPKAIIMLAQRKSEDIRSYIKQLTDIKADITLFEKDQLSQDTMAEKDHLFQDTIQPVEPETPTSPLYEPVLESIVEIETTIESIEVPEAIDVEKQKSENLKMTDVVKVTETVEVREIISTTETINEDTKKTILEEKISSRTQSRHELLSKADNSISSSLAQKKISDIKQALNIGDRFRFQRELFRGNGEEMNKTLTYINQLATFEEVESFLQSKYGWDKKNETVVDFYQLLRRKFL